MADRIIDLPTAAPAPVVNQRRRGSYGRKLVSFRMERMRRRPRDVQEQREQTHSTREAAIVLDGLSELADLEEVGDVLVYYRDRNGVEKIALAGVYKHDLAEAKRAAMNASIFLAGHR